MTRGAARETVRRAAGRRAAAAAFCGAAALVASSASSGAAATSTMAESLAASQAAVPAPASAADTAGLATPGWQVEPPAAQISELGRLAAREVAAAPALAGWRPKAERRPVARVRAVGDLGTAGAGNTAAATVAVDFALGQLGKPYAWGATGPDAYDCSGLTQRSYAVAGILLPRVAADQARAGAAVRLTDLLPGDLLFWAYDPGNVATVHHVAMYVGDGHVVHAPQPGDVVRLAPVWLAGYAGAVRVVARAASGPLLAGFPVAGAGLPAGLPDSAGPAAADPGPADAYGPSSRSGAATSPSATTPAASATPAPTTDPSPPTSPSPTEPAPTSPSPTSPSPTEPPPTSPSPTEPAATEPSPTATATTDPSPTATTDAATTEPLPTPSPSPSGSASDTAAPSAAPSTADPTATAPASTDPTATAPAPSG